MILYLGIVRLHKGKIHIFVRANPFFGGGEGGGVGGWVGFLEKEDLKFWTCLICQRGIHVQQMVN